MLPAQLDSIDEGQLNALVADGVRESRSLPDRLSESLDFDAAALLRPSFDQIWNSYGYLRSLNYNEAGEWNPRG